MEATFFLRIICGGINKARPARGDNKLRCLINYMLKGYELSSKQYPEIHAEITFIIINSLEWSDVDIINEILAVLEPYKYSNDARSLTRAQERTDTILSLLDFKPKTYLDFGCGDGSITALLAKHLGIRAYGNDIINYNLNSDVDFINPIKQIKNNTIDLVTAFVSLHHVDNLDEALSELHRIMTCGSILIIREHDYNEKQEMKAYLDFIHLFAAVKDGCRAIEEIHYRSAQSWDMKLASAGFDLKYHKKYSGNNPQGLYYGVYTRRDL